MRTNILCGSLLATALAVPLTASAADPLDSGTRFTMSIGMGNQPVMRLRQVDGPMLPPPVSGPMMTNRLGAVLGPVVAFGTFNVSSGGDHIDGDTRKSRVIAPGVGVRYNIRPMAPKKASPYVVASAYTKMLASDVETEFDKVVEDVQRSGFAGAFGGEYALAGACSVAGEVGLAHDIAKYDDNGVEWMQVSTALTSTVLLNFYF